MVRLVVVNEVTGAQHYARSLHVLRSTGWDAAKARAIELGRAHEREYQNADGQRVAWRLVDVETLDLVPDAGHLDGREVYAEFSDLDALGRELSFSSPLDPEGSEPTQTGI